MVTFIVLKKVEKFQIDCQKDMKDFMTDSKFDVQHEQVVTKKKRSIKNFFMYLNKFT